MEEQLYAAQGTAMPVGKMVSSTPVKAVPYRHAQRPVSSEILYLLRMTRISDHHRHFVPKGLGKLLSVSTTHFFYCLKCNSVNTVPSIRGC